MMSVCGTCGVQYQQRSGRGGKSAYCPDCQAANKARATAIRTMRHALVTMNEWNEALGPLLWKWRRDLMEQQEGQCFTCGAAEQSLHFALDADERLQLLCMKCHLSWVAERVRREG